MAAYISNPYRGAIDPDTIEGKKMISKMVKGLADEDKFDLKKENIMEFKDHLEETVNTFCYGPVIYLIPVQFDVTGAVTRTANLLTEPNSCPLDVVMDFAQQIWGNTDGDFRIDVTKTNEVVLNQRMRSSLLGMWIKNSLTKEGKKKLMLQKAKFRHYYEGINAYEDDRAILIRLIFDKCDPSTKLGINSLKLDLSNFSLDRYKQNVPDILDAMQMYYNQILENGG